MVLQNLPSGQYECRSCRLRSDSNAAVTDDHNQHFPWCTKYDASKRCAGTNFYRDAVKEGLSFEVVATLKQRLLLYGASVSGLKQELIDRLMPLMDVPAPELGPGSWFHFTKKETIAALEKFCKENHISVKTKAGKIDLYELVYFSRPTEDNGNSEPEGAVVKRFKDEEKCLRIFRLYNKVRRRCLVTRAIYDEVEINDLGVTDGDLWRVRSCRPRLRRDQIARGLSKLGVSAGNGIRLAKLIPRSLYPASIEVVQKYCLRNFCRDCKGAHLHGGVEVTLARHHISIPLTSHLLTFRFEDFCRFPRTRVSSC